MDNLTGPLVRGAIPTGTAATAYTVPAGHAATLEVAAFTNTTGGNLNVTVNVVPSGGTAQTSNELYHAQVINANTLSFDVFPIHLNAGDSIVWVASNTGINGYMGGSVMATSD